MIIKKERVNEMHFEYIGDTLKVIIKGDLDNHNVSVMRAEIDQEIEKHPIKNIIFDLSELEFMDSSGVGLIVGRYKRIKAFSGNVYIAGAKPAVKRVIDVSGLNKIIPIYDSADVALKTFQEVKK